MSSTQSKENLKRLFSLYLHKMLETYFFTYPSFDTEFLFGLFRQTIPTLVIDIKRQYPDYSQDQLLDTRFIELIQIDARMEAIFYYRLAREIFLVDKNHSLLPHIANLMKFRSGAEIYYSADIEPGLNIQHGAGIVIGPRHKIGRNFTIYQGVTLGQRYMSSPTEAIEIGDNVSIFAGAKVFGNVKIGNHVWIGANAVLLENAQSHSVYAGVPARKVRDLQSCKGV